MSSHRSLSVAWIRAAFGVFAIGPGGLLACEPAATVQPLAHPELPAPLFQQAAPASCRASEGATVLEQASFKGIDGELHPIRTNDRPVTLLNLWGTWCAPCKEELPEFDRLARHYASAGLRVLAGATDEEATAVREFVRARGLELSAAVGGATYAESFGARDFPMSFVIDPDGKVQAFFEGYDRRCLPAVEYELRRALTTRE